MKVLQINNIDLPGRRFNGHDLQVKLNQMGIDCKNMVFDKVGNDTNTVELANERDHHLRTLYWKLEDKLSIQNLLFPFGWKILNHDDFKGSDIVHYHLIHNMFMSLYSFLELTKRKPAVWTIHDPWAFTGHCIYPKECDKWKHGCVGCPNKDIVYPMKDDKAAQMWKIKKEIYSKMDVDIIVASDYMKNMMTESPLATSFKRIHKISFGVNLNKFKPLDMKECRKNLGIPEDDFVITFRAINTGFKGIEYIKEMLRILRPTKPVTLLIVNEEGLFDTFKQSYNIIEFGWVYEDEKMSSIYGASDVFLMPSVVEAFGLMAIEAMACERPVIVFDGTSLPSISFAPECGILVKKYDSRGLKEAVERLMVNEKERIYRGKLGRELAEKHYDEKIYYDKIINLYREVSRKKMANI